MAKCALILGCSHAAGAMMYTGKQDMSKWERDNSYPVQFARLFGYDAVNLSVSGGSNDAMFRIATEQHRRFDLIVACWTGADRYETNRLPLISGDYYKQRVTNETVQDNQLNRIKNILATNMLGTPVINFDSFQGIHDFPWPESVYRPITNSDDEFCSWGYRNGYKTESTGHFAVDAHIEYANFLYNKVDKRRFT